MWTGASILPHKFFCCAFRHLFQILCPDPLTEELKTLTVQSPCPVFAGSGYGEGTARLSLRPFFPERHAGLSWLFSYTSPRTMLTFFGASMDSLRSPSMDTTCMTMSSPITRYSPGFLPRDNISYTSLCFAFFSYRNGANIDFQGL